MPDLVLIGIAVILVGFLVVFISLMMASRSSNNGERRTEVKGGGVILIGPIPIVFGTDARWTSIAIVLTIVLIILVLVSGVLAGR
jgi:uncharacterized protein (TIGR00304 family)